MAISDDVKTLYQDGIIGLKGAFPTSWVDDMREDMMTAFWSAIQRPGGAVGRGPRRWYVEIHPQDFRGFAELVSHPWVVAMCEAVCGPEFEIVEIGFDVPFQGAKDQPWHRDFPSPPDTYDGKAHHLAGFQPYRCRCRAGYGTVRDRNRDAMGGWPPLEPRDVSGKGTVAAFCRERGSQVSPAWRHFLPLGADHSPGNGTRLAHRAARPGTGCRCTRCGTFCASRHDGHSRLF